MLVSVTPMGTETSTSSYNIKVSCLLFDLLYARKSRRVESKYDCHATHLHRNNYANHQDSRGLS